MISNTSAFQDRINDLKEEYKATHPNSRQMMATRSEWMPGGNTRSVLHFDPFPLVIQNGVGARIFDVDGFEYLDCVGEFSAGLYGHSDPEILDAVREALSSGVVLGGPNLYEDKLAEQVCNRFASIDLVRFCNSGTEANVLAAVTACEVTHRSKIVVFDGAYHGGVMTFAGGGNPMNVPFDWVVLPYNDVEAVHSYFSQNGNKVAAVFVEPVLGAAGNLPGTTEFLKSLRVETEKSGSVLIFDEVKTSRLGKSGVQGLKGICPDLTTFGKYLGGGFPLGAFGGRKEIMERFNPYAANNLKHAGTFNNNVCSMAAGLAGLSSVFTENRAETFLEMTEAFRRQLGEALTKIHPNFHVTGLGSLLSLHVGEREPQRAADVTEETAEFRYLLSLKGISNGILFTGRGDIFLSLPMTDTDLKQLQDQIVKTANEYQALTKP
jgi:glutamate-1-semialdehyde 2,1-aminomutase